MSTPAEDLSSLYTHIITPCYHRNKNQHRVAKWWKPFSMLRQHTKKLIFELEDLERDEKFADGKENRFVVKSRERVEEHAEWLGKWIEERCYLAFSTVVADGQYANLGLMLMGLLAQIRAIVQSLRPELEVKEEAKSDMPEEPVGGSERVDFGEVVKRGNTTKNTDGNLFEEEEGIGKLQRPTKTKKRSLAENKPAKVKVRNSDSSSSRKKKRKGDE